MVVPKESLWDDFRFDRAAPAWQWALMVLWAPLGLPLMVLRIICFWAVAVPGFSLTRALFPGNEHRLLRVVHPLLGAYNRRVWKNKNSVYYRDLEIGRGGAKQDVSKGGKFYTPMVCSNHRSDYDFVPYQFKPFGALVSPYWKKVDEFLLRMGLDMGFVYARTDFKATGSEKSELVRQAITNHVSQFDVKEAPFLFFPEGATTNGKALLQFQKFNFSLGYPVQPVALRIIHPIPFPLRIDCLRDSFLSNIMAATFYPMNVFESTYLPPMSMSDADRATDDPAAAFAARVQKAIAAELGIPCTTYTFKDKNALRQNWSPY